MDTIGDMLTTINNAQRVQKKRVAVPFSRFKESLAKLLQEKGLIASMRVQEGPQPKLIMSLSYDDKGRSRITGLRRSSRPGRRLYVTHDTIPYVKDGMGMAIISTSQGLMDDKKARKERVGGELICEIW